MDNSEAGAMIFDLPTDPHLVSDFRRQLKGLSPFPMALQWNIPSIDGVLALQLVRSAMIEPVLQAEVNDIKSNRPGLRLIDIFGVRFISRSAPLANPGLSLYSEDHSQNIFIYRNPSARPRIQVYWNANMVDTPKQALSGMQSMQNETLFVERLPGDKSDSAVSCPACTVSKFHVEMIEARAMRYKLNVDVDRDAWLFLADANYPGWQATVNGLRQPVYSAQVLGKAVRLKAGHNEVIIKFVPWSFYLGASLSGVSLLLVLLLILRRR